jgi:hypothetical protein
MVDVLFMLSEDFEVEQVAEPARIVFDALQARLMFAADVFWARVSIGEEILDLWLDAYQMSRNFTKRGIVELENL